MNTNAEDFEKPGERETIDYLSDISKKLDIIIIGSIPEKNGDKLFNTAVCYQNG